jgi:hypothetical protein
MFEETPEHTFYACINVNVQSVWRFSVSKNAIILHEDNVIYFLIKFL